MVPDEAGAGAGEVDEEELPGSPDLLRGCLGVEGDYTACRGSGEGIGGRSRPCMVNRAPNTLLRCDPTQHPGISITNPQEQLSPQDRPAQSRAEDSTTRGCSGPPPLTAFKARFSISHLPKPTSLWVFPAHPPGEGCVHSPGRIQCPTVGSGKPKGRGLLSRGVSPMCPLTPHTPGGGPVPPEAQLSLGSSPAPTS